MDTSRLVLEGDWSAILNSDIDGQEIIGCGDRSLVDMICKFGLINRYWVDQPEEEMWIEC